MPRPFVRKKFAAQPAFPSTIDPSHPIGRKVTACISAHYGAAIQAPEMISGIPATVASGAINTVTVGIAGKALRPSSVNSALYWPARAAFGDCSQPFSVEILFTILANDTQFARVFDFGGAQGGGVTGGWDIEADATAGTYNFVYWDNVGAAHTLTPAPLSGLVIKQTYHLVITSLGQNASTATFYVNNARTTATTAANPGPATSPNFFYSTYRTVGDLSASSWCVHYARFYQGTELTALEVKRLYERPFEMFRPPRKILGNSVSGGGVTLALTGVQATSAAGSVGTGQLLTVPLTGTASTSAVGSVGTGQLLTLALTGVSVTSSAGTVGVIAGGDKTFALTGVQAQTQVGNVGVQGADSTSQGGHFLPLTEKQLRNLKKEERKRKRQEDDREAARLADARSIEAEIRELAFPTPVKPQESSVETATDDDDDEDLELILLHS